MVLLSRHIRETEIVIKIYIFRYQRLYVPSRLDAACSLDPQNTCSMIIMGYLAFRVVFEVNNVAGVRGEVSWKQISYWCLSRSGMQAIKHYFELAKNVIKNFITMLKLGSGLVAYSCNTFNCCVR